MDQLSKYYKQDEDDPKMLAKAWLQIEKEAEQIKRKIAGKTEFTIINQKKKYQDSKKENISINKSQDILDNQIQDELQQLKQKRKELQMQAQLISNDIRGYQYSNKDENYVKDKMQEFRNEHNQTKMEFNFYKKLNFLLMRKKHYLFQDFMRQMQFIKDKSLQRENYFIKVMKYSKLQKSFLIWFEHIKMTRDSRKANQELAQRKYEKRMEEKAVNFNKFFVKKLIFTKLKEVTIYDARKLEMKCLNDDISQKIKNFMINYKIQVEQKELEKNEQILRDKKPLQVKQKLTKQQLDEKYKRNLIIQQQQREILYNYDPHEEYIWEDIYKAEECDEIVQQNEFEYSRSEIQNIDQTFKIQQNINNQYFNQLIDNDIIDKKNFHQNKTKILNSEKTQRINKQLFKNFYNNNDQFDDSYYNHDINYLIQDHNDQLVKDDQNDKQNNDLIIQDQLCDEKQCENLENQMDDYTLELNIDHQHRDDEINDRDEIIQPQKDIIQEVDDYLRNKELQDVQDHQEIFQKKSAPKLNKMQQLEQNAFLRKKNAELIKKKTLRNEKQINRDSKIKRN